VQRLAGMKNLVVYFAPSCAFSAGTIAYLVGRGAEFRAVNLELDDQRTELEAELGDRTLETPILRADGELLVAPSLAELERRLLAVDLPAAAAPREKRKAAGKRQSVADRESQTRH
jgi:glutaredoxin